MKLIPLTKGYHAMVDDEDFEWLSQWRWHARVAKHTVYAAGISNGKHGKRVGLKMHRVIMGITDRNIQIDHKDRNGLNNTRENIRLSTARENGINRGSRKNSSSRFKGVSWDKGAARWLSAISINGKTRRIGLFEDEEEAARQFNNMARDHHGEFAVYNDVSPTFAEKSWEIPATISTNKSGFRGVTLHQGTGKWFACIREFGKTKYLGLFKDPIVAARLYDEKARELFGDAAKTNFK